MSPSEFYRQFKDNTEEGKRVAFNIGRECGGIEKSRNNIQGDDLEAIADVLNAAATKMHVGGHATVEKNRVVLNNTGFCAVMRSSLTLGIPWE